MSKKPSVILFGASGHGKVIADIIHRCGEYELVGFCDDRYEQADEKFFGYPVLGGKDALLAYAKDHPDVKVIIAIGNNPIRASLIQWLDENGLEMATAIHPSADVAEDVEIGAGTVVMARGIVNSGATLGRGCIVNTAACVDHDCHLGECVHVAPGTRLCGLVQMGDLCWAGTGSVVIPAIQIGSGVKIEAGAVVVQKIEDNQTVAGVPASLVETPAPTAPPKAKQDISPAKASGKKSDQFNILFTCAGRRVELIQNFRHAMATLGLQGRIEVTDAEKFVAARQAADELFQTPHVRQLKYIPHLLEIVKEQEIDLLIPLTDLDIRPLARHQKKFKDVGCTIMVGSSAAVDTCRNKLRFAKHLEKNGIPHIPCHELKAFLKNQFFPCFAKPLAGSGSVGTCRLENTHQLRNYLRAYTGEVVIQPFVSGQDYTIDVYRAKNGKFISIVPRLRLCVRSGEIEQGITIRDPELIAMTRQLCETIPGLWGAFCCQCRKTPEGEYLFYELNPRFGGGTPLSIAAGANMPLYLLQDVRGLNITSDGSFQKNLLMLRYPAAIFEEMDNPESLSGYDAPIFR